MSRRRFRSLRRAFANHEGTDDQHHDDRNVQAPVHEELITLSATICKVFGEGGYIAWQRTEIA